MSSNAIAWTNLKAAAITACAARGDSKQHRDAVLEELRELPVDEWAWWQTYFESEARIARAAA